MSMCIAGIVCLAMGGWLLIHAVKNRVPKGEWATACGIYGLILMIIGVGIPPLLYFNSACFIVFLLSSFFLKYGNYEKDKAEFLKRPHEGQSVVCAELIDSRHPTLASMRVWADGQEAGQLTPHNRQDAAFTYGARDMRRAYIMLLTERESPIIGWRDHYVLECDEHTCLRIRQTKRNRVELKTATASIEAPLYQRHIILHKEQKQILELHLYDKGLFLACDKQDREIYLCFAYYAWLMIFGDRRKND